MALAESHIETILTEYEAQLHVYIMTHKILKQ